MGNKRSRSNGPGSGKFNIKFLSVVIYERRLTKLAGKFTIEFMVDS
jgi:hypothetical protein